MSQAPGFWGGGEAAAREASCCSGTAAAAGSPAALQVGAAAPSAPCSCRPTALPAARAPLSGAGTGCCCSCCAAASSAGCRQCVALRRPSIGEEEEDALRGCWRAQRRCSESCAGAVLWELAGVPGRERERAHTQVCSQAVLKPGGAVGRTEREERASSGAACTSCRSARAERERGEREREMCVCACACVGGAACEVRSALCALLCDHTGKPRMR